MLAAVNPVALSECGQRHSGRSQVADRGRYAPLAGYNYQSLARAIRPRVRSPLTVRV
jgi:hypothetical protein